MLLTHLPSVHCHSTLPLSSPVSLPAAFGRDYTRLHWCNFSGSSIPIFKNLFAILFGNLSKNLGNVIWEISDWTHLVKPSWHVLLCFVPPSGGFSALRATDVTERCLQMSDMSRLSSAHNFCLQPHICNDNRLRQASEKCLLLYDSSHHMNVHKRNNSIAIPKSNYYNKCKNQTRTKPELKWWKAARCYTM